MQPVRHRRQGGPGRPWPKGTSGNPRGKRRGPNHVTLEVKALARQLLEDETYRRAFVAALHARTLAPALEAMLWAYAYGRPTEHHVVDDTSTLVTEVIHRHITVPAKD